MHLDKEIIEELEGKIPEYSDHEIQEILRKRNHYNPLVAQMAIQEAIKRGIVNSEDDLVAEEYRVEKLRFRIFPPIEKEKTRNQVIKSLSRAVLLVGIIPVIFGFIELFDKHFLNAFILIVLGGIWIITTSFLMRTKKRQLVYVVMAMAALSTLYVLSMILKVTPIKFLDVFIAVVMYGIVFYCLLYIHSLLNISLKELNSAP